MNELISAYLVERDILGKVLKNLQSQELLELFKDESYKWTFIHWRRKEIVVLGRQIKFYELVLRFRWNWVKGAFLTADIGGGSIVKK